jgi:Ca2+-binding RTX toxin-like protein
LSGAAVGSGNGAGIRYEGGNLTLTGDYLHNNQDGLLANSDPNGTISITGSEFANNGAGDGFTHDIYVNAVKALVIDGSYIHDAVLGHEVKSRALSTTITNSRIYDGSGTASYSIDLPNGGAAVINNNVIEQGANSANPVIISYGEEGSVYAGSSLVIDGNTVVNDLTAHVPLMLNNATTVAATVGNNEVYGLTSSQIASGPATVSGTIPLTARPTLDTSAPWPDNSVSGAAAANAPVSAAAASAPVSTAAANTFVGTAGADTLVGTAGADVMSGGAGNDTYYVNNAGDQVIEAVGGGTDTVYASVNWAMAPGQEIENLRAYGAAETSGVTLTGNEFNNELIGGTGNDILDGKGGSDTLIGGGGNDVFRFDTTLSAGNLDTVADFNSSTDTLDLDHTVFTGLTPGVLASASFALDSANGAGPQIVYNHTTGALFFDSNGAAAGGATEFASLSGAPTLTASRIVVF